jgi:hypothetical protein
MTTHELQAELASIKDIIAQLQASINHLSSLIAAEQPDAKAAAPETKWLALAGVGAELWRSVDVDAYIDEERKAWQ